MDRIKSNKYLYNTKEYESHESKHAVKLLKFEPVLHLWGFHYHIHNYGLDKVEFNCHIIKLIRYNTL